MALLKCVECGGSVSSRAPACPHCGCPLDATSALPMKPLASSLASAPPRSAALVAAGAAPSPSPEAVAAPAPEPGRRPGPTLPLEVLTHAGLTTLSLDRLVTVGRSKANILVEHQDVAPTHCRVEPLEKSWRVVDLADHGLFEAGQRVAVAELRAGEIVDLGGFPGAVSLALPSALDEPMAFELHVPGRSAETLLLQKLPMVIGRASWVDLPLADRNVSHVHARLRIERGRVVLDDLGSRNGTWVNGQRAKTGRELRHGDRLRFGETEITFGRPAHVEATRPLADAHAAAVGGTSQPSVIIGQSVIFEADRTPAAAQDVVIPPGLSIEQLAAAPDLHVHVPRVRHDVTQVLPRETDSCPACSEAFSLRSGGVITGALLLARTAVRLVRQGRPGPQVGRCSSCGARLAMCPECGTANTAPTLFEPIACRRCGEAFSAG